MNVITDINEIKQPFINPVVTIGNFDGVHKGHQAIFHQVIEKAESIKGTSVAITFEPHPVKVLKKNDPPPLITLYEQKIELISKTGLDVLICIPFNKEFAEISADQFLEEILVKKIGTKAIVIGRDYSFGKNREGNVAYLRQNADKLGYEVIVADWIPVTHNIDGRISSTRVREFVMAGIVGDAVALLGRHYQIRGKVQAGRNRGGRLLGFPTANINIVDELCPKIGVYAVTVECSYGNYKGVANIGYSPTFDDHVFTIEVHLLDFNKDIYGQDIRVNFIKRIRDEKKFSNIDELSEQIKKDVLTGREILSHF
ncbi:MAG: bifunctional riboflavin kinase/FAD synthetase [Desulfobacteraceae bacterium]|nr:bifunctional riboflavin kinase/FAD synthetase [Desulfobacteraceae bacterium]MBC2755783.1 bifunctional riboflavin kinase/FAD synthetase [Desulfobacteraceae bacterium]